jgi:RsmE family RNA methyltransferase
MNLILFERDETHGELPLSDPRARHILDVLRIRAGDRFDAGLIDGPRVTGTLVAIGKESLRLSFEWGAEPPPLDPITLIVGLPRPQTARRILHEATAMGVCALLFVATDRGEASYAQSRLWTTGEWRRHLIDGAQQAFTTRLPAVSVAMPLATAIDSVAAGGTRLALDNYEAPCALSAVAATAPVTLALGPERGWSDRERETLRRSGFGLVHLGERVLRTETACVAGLTLVKAKLGLF